MSKSKKFSMLLFSIVLVLSSLLFVACGKLDYSQSYLSASPEYVELFVGEEKNLTITIENPVAGMSKLLNVSKSSDKCDVVETTHNDYATTYTITGKEGGKTTIDFVAVDGGAKISVDVVVRQYSNDFNATSQSMFITKNSALVPTKTDFVFDNNVSERELEFYFYGTYQEGQNLSLEDVKDSEGKYVNGFVSATLIEKNWQTFIIFADQEGKTYTLSKTKEGNRYKFIEAPLNADGKTYDFEEKDASAVKAGERYVFISKYLSHTITGEVNELYATKPFAVFDSIALKTEATEFTYKDSQISEPTFANGRPQAHLPWKVLKKTKLHSFLIISQV
ncbi:MAG: hypothetical protein J6A28_02580 [Clostridia bacterium]|nr:hypothetical protein [Clostridia bacterium]